MADGCHLCFLSMWNWNLIKDRASVPMLQRWVLGELENKQQIVLKTRTNRGGHNCDLGPLNNLKVIWGHQILDLGAACKTTLIKRRVYRTQGWAGEHCTPHMKGDLRLFTLYSFKFRLVWK